MRFSAARGPQRIVAPDGSAIVPGCKPRPAVAALTFANLGGEATPTYFSDGLSEDITPTGAASR
jgi:TolB-like protein